MVAVAILPLYDRMYVLHKSRFEITAIENFDFDETAVQPSLGFQTSFIYKNVPCEVKKLYSVLI